MGGRVKEMYFVYILKSKIANKFYIGYTGDLNKRIIYHNNGKNISTKNHLPWEVVYSESFQTKKEAWLREHQIKSYKGGVAFKKLLE